MNRRGFPTLPMKTIGYSDLSAVGSRRQFLCTAATIAAATTIVPAQVLGAAGNPSANNRLALAGVGVGGVGFGQLKECADAGFQIVALCDVDDAYAKKAYEQWPQARRYRDYRDMLQAEGDKVDAKAVYHPFNFRGWWDFGNGSLGDMGCHHFNTPMRALQLAMPTRIYASASKVLVRLGNVAIRVGKPLEWDAERNQFSNNPDANKYLREAYHNGWSLDAV